MDVNDQRSAKTYILVILIFLLLVMFIVNESTYIKIDNSSITIEKYPSATEQYNINNHLDRRSIDRSHHFNGDLHDHNTTE